MSEEAWWEKRIDLLESENMALKEKVGNPN
jgi:hypothetical protein